MNYARIGDRSRVNVIRATDGAIYCLDCCLDDGKTFEATNRASMICHLQRHLAAAQSVGGGIERLLSESREHGNGRKVAFRLIDPCPNCGEDVGAGWVGYTDDECPVCFYDRSIPMMLNRHDLEAVLEHAALVVEAAVTSGEIHRAISRDDWRRIKRGIEIVRRDAIEASETELKWTQSVSEERGGCGTKK